jgi:hypothetical protein
MSSNAQKPELNLRENAVDIGSGAAVSLESSSLSLALSGLFKGVSAPDADAHDKAKRDQEKEFVIHQLEQGRALKNGQITSEQVTSCVGAFMQAAITARGAETVRAEAKAKSDEMMFLALLDRIRDDIDRMEASLIERYGENFAEDIIASLAEKDMVDQAELDRINAIEDPKDRRDAIAEIINAKLKSGEISMDDLDSWKDDPLVHGWLEAHEERLDAIEAKAQECIDKREIPEGTPQEVIDKIDVLLREENKSHDDLFGPRKMALSNLPEQTADPSSLL